MLTGTVAQLLLLDTGVLHGINTSIATEDLTTANQIGFPVDIAEGVTREAKGLP